MRFRLTIVLLLLNIAVFSILYFVRQSRPGTAYEESARLVLPVGLMESAERLSIEIADPESRWTFERRRDEWQVRAPFDWQANPFAMDRLTQQISRLRWEARFRVDSLRRSGQTLAQYGLDPARVVIRLERGEEAWSLAIGQPTEVGNRLYVLSPSGEEVLVVSRDALAGVADSVQAFLSHDVLTIPAFEARAVSVQSAEAGGIRVRLTRQVDDSWVLESPLRASADTTRLLRYLDRLNTWEVERFTDVTPEQAGTTSPFLRLTVEGNNRRQTLLLGNRTGDRLPARRYLQIEGRAAVVVVEEEPFLPFFQAQESLRERRFLSLGGATATSIILAQGERSTRLQQLEEGRWQVVFSSPEGRLQTLPADTGVVSDLLERLTLLEAERFVTEAPSESEMAGRYGLAPPQRQVTIVLAGDRPPVELLLGNLDAEDGLLYARRAGMPTIFKVRPGILGAVPLSPMHYRDQTLDRLPPGAELTAFRIVRHADDAVLFSRALTPSLDSWEAIEIAEGDPLRDHIHTVRQALRRFTVRSYVQNRFTDPLELDSETALPWIYRLEADVRLPGSRDEAPRTLRYHLSERLGGRTQYGGSEADQVIFVLRPSLIDALQSLLDAAGGAEPEPAPLPIDTPLPSDG
jgi:hypothetical protein